ncbi:MAG: tetratricopeptide repeat protein [Bacteroidota bacterium]|nr:tetratricopeptide repeat protein [Bacteroidota bacterium]
MDFIKASIKKNNYFLILVFTSIFLVNWSCSYAQLNIRNYIEIGKRSLFQGDNEEAIRRFNAVVKVNPDLYQPYFFRGVAKFNLKDYIGARTDFSVSIELHPYFTHAYHYRGIAQERLNNYNSALQDYNSAIEIDPVNPDIYSSRGFTRILLTDTLGALEDFNEAILIDPHNYQAYLSRSMVWSMMEKYNLALEDCKKAISIDKYNIGSFYRRGLIYYYMEDFTNARDDFNFIIQVDSINSRAFYYRALTRYKQNDLKGAMADYDKVLEIDPLNALTFYNRAILRTQVGDNQGAIFDYDHVVDLNPNNIFAYYNRGGAKLTTGDLYGAIADFTKVIELYPGFTQAYFNRSIAKSKLYDFAGAQKDRLLAEKISNDSLFLKDLAQIDSTYFDEIIELKANFDNGNIATGKTSSMSSSIKMKSVYIISVVEENYRNPIFEPDIQKMNISLDRVFLLGFVRTDNLTGEQKYDFNKKLEELSLKQDTYLTDFLEGILSGNKHDFNSAFDKMNEALVKSPDNYLIHFNIGGLKFQLTELLNTMEVQNDFLLIADRKSQKVQTENVSPSRYFDIIQQYDRVLVLKPGFSPAYYNRAYIKSLVNDLPGAIYDYGQAISLNKEFREAYYNRGLINIYLNETERGCQDLSKAGELGLREAYYAISKYCR